jgi:hypothetical protein
MSSRYICHPDILGFVLAQDISQHLLYYYLCLVLSCDILVW